MEWPFSCFFFFQAKDGIRDLYVTVVQTCALPILLRGVFQGFGRRSRIQKVESDIIDNPSPANYEELGELYKDQGQFEKAREAFTSAIAARSDSIYTFYSRAQSSLGLNDLAGAIPDLERVVAAERKFDYYRAAGLLADAYARTGQLER